LEVVKDSDDILARFFSEKLRAEMELLDGSGAQPAGMASFDCARRVRAVLRSG
jgi:hypothetical protein